jgi:hypothetical protein
VETIREVAANGSGVSVDLSARSGDRRTTTAAGETALTEHGYSGRTIRSTPEGKLERNMLFYQTNPPVNYRNWNVL